MPAWDGPPPPYRIETERLVIRAGWTPDSQEVYFYVQNRAQTWLDFCTASPRGGGCWRCRRSPMRRAISSKT